MTRLSLAAVMLAVLSGCAPEAPKFNAESDLEIISHPQPEYPKAAVDRGVEGCVVVTFEVNANGLADQYQVLDSQPAGIFDQVTLVALNKAKFGPGTLPGRHAWTYHFLLANFGHTDEQIGKMCKPMPSYVQLNAPVMAGAGDEQIGCVVAVFDVDDSGTTSKAQIIDSQPPGRFDQTALAALQKLHFDRNVKPGRAARVFEFIPDHAARTRAEAAALCRPAPTQQEINQEFSGKL